MTACSVLRCLEAASRSFALLPYSERHVPICFDHKTLLDDGAPWMAHPSTTDLEALRDGSGPVDVTILMERDLPSQPRLISFDLGSTIGSEAGLFVEITLQTSDGQQDVKFWLPEQQAKDFRSLVAEQSPQ